MLCKHGVSGSIPLASTHTFYIVSLKICLRMVEGRAGTKVLVRLEISNWVKL